MEAETLVVDGRRARGLALAKSARIKNVTGALWIIPSASHSGTYVVNTNEQSCSCPDHEDRKVKCKHLWALEFARHQVVEADGTKVVEQSLQITYRQDWRAYNAAQTNEKEHVSILLKSLCSGIVFDRPMRPQRGRPRLPLSDVVYSAVMKTFTGFSARRAMSDIRESKAKGLTDVAPHFNTTLTYFEKPELTPVLTALIEESAAPLTKIERNFAADATGFSTSTYYRWFDAKYGREMSAQKWIKLHASVGVLSNVVTCARMTAGTGEGTADCPHLPALVEGTAKRFAMAEVSADKAYLSSENLEAIEKVGAKPYIPFKINSTADGGNGSEAWQRMHALFTLNKDEFLRSYHRRSNVESTFFMIKKKFGAAVRARLEAAQFNEVLCKVLCHNLSVLVHSTYELGFEPRFWIPQAEASR